MMIFFFFYMIFKLYAVLNIYQQSHYNIKEYCKYFLANFIFYDLWCILAVLIGEFTDFFLVQIFVCVFLILYSLFYLYMKIPLKFSKRILRLIILNLIYLFGILWIPYAGVFLCISLEFSILPILFLEQILAYFLNKKYLDSAKEKIKSYSGKKIIITGSYGKTSTKLLFQQILNIYEHPIATPKSYNTPLGISKFLNSTTIEAYSSIILEYGASKPKDIQKLCEITEADVAVITEIGYMHLVGFKTLENIIKEKMSLATNAKVVILNYDNEYIRNYPLRGKILLSYGFVYGDYTARNIEGGSFDFYYKEQFINRLDTSLIGKHQILNLLAVLSYVHYMGYDLDKVVQGVKLLKVERNRLEFKKIGNRIIFDDSFNSNIKGFENALKMLGQYPYKKILITPGMVELGKYQKEAYQELTPHIVKNTDVVILVGYKECKKIYDLLKGYPIEVYLTNSFKEGYALYLCIGKGQESAVLIENDLPDIYKRGWKF